MIADLDRLRATPIEVLREQTESAWKRFIGKNDEKDLATDNEEAK